MLIYTIALTVKLFSLLTLEPESHWPVPPRRRCAHDDLVDLRHRQHLRRERHAAPHARAHPRFAEDAGAPREQGRAVRGDSI